tara:strand:- start:5729 stop:6052 length:324 start_codon:yes stop_codon:yes gene_type:complete
MNIIWMLHFLLPISVILMPLLPVKILKYVLWYPSIYFLIWGLNDGKCPITEITPIDKTNTDRHNFLLPIVRRLLNTNIKEKSFNWMLGFVKCLAIVISAYKVIYYCK